jgi:hypothetical protein
MPDVERFSVFITAAFVLFLTGVVWVIRRRITKPSLWMLLVLATIVVPIGMVFARYSHIFMHDLPWEVYYGAPALIMSCRSKLPQTPAVRLQASVASTV